MMRSPNVIPISLHMREPSDSRLSRCLEMCHAAI